MAESGAGPARRAQIMDAATLLFAQKGFAGTRMDDIVAQTGLSKGTLYWYFKSKDDIIAGILQRFFSLEMDSLAAVAAADGSVADRLLQLNRRLALDFRQMRPLWSVALEFYALAARDASVRRFLEQYFAQYQVSLAALIQQGIERGEFHAGGATSQELALGLIALYEGLALLWSFNPEVVDWERLTELSLRLFLQGLSPPKENAPATPANSSGE